MLRNQMQQREPSGQPFAVNDAAVENGCFDEGFSTRARVHRFGRARLWPGLTNLSGRKPREAGRHLWVKSDVKCVFDCLGYGRLGNEAGRFQVLLDALT